MYYAKFRSQILRTIEDAISWHENLIASGKNSDGSSNYKIAEHKALREKLLSKKKMPSWKEEPLESLKLLVAGSAWAGTYIALLSVLSFLSYAVIADSKIWLALWIPFMIFFLLARAKMLEEMRDEHEYE